MPLYGGFAPTHGQTLGTVEFSGVIFEIIKLDWTGIKREAIEVTNMNVLPTTGTGFGNKMFIPSAYVDPGMLKLQILHDPTQQIPITDPSDSGPVAITIKIGPSSSTQESFNGLGFVTDYDIDGPLDGKAMTATVSVKLTDLVDNTYDPSGAMAWTSAG
jgi:hypothetical protein